MDLKLREKHNKMDENTYDSVKANNKIDYNTKKTEEKKTKTDLFKQIRNEKEMIRW